jgi:undecaprenyl-diphosphatase
MDTLDTLFQAVLQGLTEFLPVSSSGHLVVFQDLFRVRQPHLLMDVSLHAGTFLAVVIYFWKDIREMAVSFVSRPFDLSRERTNEVWKIIVASVPTGLIGLLIEKKFSSVFESLGFVLAFLLVTAVMLFVSDFLKPGTKNVKGLSWPGALLIGLFQGIAVLPGISRSGATITGGIVAGLERRTAGRFAFLIGIPAMLGAIGLEAFDAVKSGLSTEFLFHVVLAAAVACVISFFTIRLLFWVLAKVRMRLFSLYLVILVAAVVVAKMVSGNGW